MKPLRLLIAAGLLIAIAAFARAGSVYEQLSLKDGDVISEINGQPVADPADALKRMNAPGGVGRVQVIRDGKPVELKRDCGPVPPGGSFDQDCNIVVVPAPGRAQ